MGFFDRLFGGGGQQVDGDRPSCRGWVEQVEPYKVPAVFPVELTVEPLPEAVSISLGNAHSGATNPRDMSSGALQIGAFHNLSGRGSNEPFLLPYSGITALAGRVVSVKMEGSMTYVNTIETIGACRTEPLPEGKTFKFDITYRPPARGDSLIMLTLVADHAQSTEDPKLTLALFNRIANAIAEHASTSPTEA